MNPVLTSSKKHDYWTPNWLIAEVDRVHPINLDVASCEANPVGAEHIFDLEAGQDGLALPWSNGWWCNPPYGREIPKWVIKASQEYLGIFGGGSKVGTMLVPARPGTGWYRTLVYYASAVCYLDGRLTFIDPATGQDCKSCAAFPSMLAYFGPNTDQFIEVFGKHGDVRVL